MDVGTLNGWKLDEGFSAAEIVSLINSEYPVEPVDANSKDFEKNNLTFLSSKA